MCLTSQTFLFLIDDRRHNRILYTLSTMPSPFIRNFLSNEKSVKIGKIAHPPEKSLHLHRPQNLICILLWGCFLIS